MPEDIMSSFWSISSKVLMGPTPQLEDVPLEQVDAVEGGDGRAKVEQADKGEGGSNVALGGTSAALIESINARDEERVMWRQRLFASSTVMSFLMRLLSRRRDRRKCEAAALNP